MPKAKRYSAEQIRDAQKKLRSMAAKKVGKTRAETVDLLAGDIRKAMEKGHSLEDIRNTLAGAGIQAPLSRLKSLFDETGEEPGQKEETAGGGVSLFPAASERELAARVETSAIQGRRDSE